MTDIITAKKKFQKVIATIRKDMGNGQFPKAMMTEQQSSKRQATVNCGGEWSAERSKPRADAVMADERFRKFLEECEATARLEAMPRFNAVQIRIQF